MEDGTAPFLVGNFLHEKIVGTGNAIHLVTVEVIADNGRIHDRQEKEIVLIFLIDIGSPGKGSRMLHLSFEGNFPRHLLIFHHQDILGIIGADVEPVIKLKKLAVITAAAVNRQVAGMMIVHIPLPVVP